MLLNRIKSQEIQDWIEVHKNDIFHDLAFKKSPFSEIDMPQLLQQLQGRKIAAKKFEYYNQKGFVFPPKINLEQTSSKTTADYKSSLVEGDILMDITGGFGIDDVAFASKFRKVVHIESNPQLQTIAEHNFKHLGLLHISSYAQDGIEFLSQFNATLDVLYVDPSRRDSSKNRVFLLEDMSPNVLENMSLFQKKAKVVLLKLSPLIDLNYLLQTIPSIAEIHVIGVKNEVKEVLVKITWPYQRSAKIYSVNLDTDHKNFVYESNEVLSVQVKISILEKYLYEPNPSIQKSGAKDLLAFQMGLKKLHPNTQLYTSDIFHKDFPGRVFEVGEKIKSPKKELKNKSIMAIHRNFPEGLTELRKKYKFNTDGLEPILFARNLDHIIIYRLHLKKL